MVGEVLLKGVTLLGNTPPDPVAAAVTANAVRYKQNTDALNAANQASEQYSGSSETDGDFGNDTPISEEPKVVSSMTESEVKYFENMKDSNVPYYYKHDENDLMRLAASQTRDYAWSLKEEIFLYTMHDRQKHKYITSISIDSDAQNICSTCQIDMPYHSDLMEYWIPGTTVFMIIGGTFDREVLFVGRVSEINQLGDTIKVTGQNIGWKFKQYMSEEFYKKIQAQPVPIVVKAIFKQLGFTEGKYLIDLWAIPNVFKYKLDEDCTIKYEDETVQNVPELKDVVKRMEEADINKYVATRAKVNETQPAADKYDESTKKQVLSTVVMSSTKAKSSSYRKNYGVKTSIQGNEVSYDPIEYMLYGTNKTYEYFSNDSSGDGEYTYEEVMKNIAAAIDAQFFIVDTTVCFVSFNSLMALSKSEAIVKAIQPRIEYWQLEDKSYELDINQYGYYNTVIIKYKNGTLKRSFEDLVRVYGEIPITYEEKDLSYEGAQLKAQAYLAAHVRDFGMTVKFNMLYTGKITVASFIKVQNPLTMSESLLYVYGISVNWNADGETLTCSMDCRYGPENPDNPEIPEYGLGYSGSQNAVDNSFVYSGDVPADVTQAARKMIGNLTNPTAKGAAIYNWVDQNVKYECYPGYRYSSSQILTGKRANCYDTAHLIYNLCTAVGVKCEIHNGTYHFLDGNWAHLWNKIEQNGQMVFADTGRDSQNPLGQHGAGRYIVSDSCTAKNY